ncbi:hypothetical protein P7D22_06515 [Lichenihabitans sp. Uapishka_5]|uniref:hypothetical protein n=1 Tax=Lichenihabitans sp. Uapishka_5 TaxID=3037302 RepID=UPI0029E80B48|nr:hypothetical protein [Lichenihabitans sp. Uapishka_5]MDX7950830.1 hypothetical protein [Lichenihabitans sp. Uapishka_5]
MLGSNPSQVMAGQALGMTRGPIRRIVLDRLNFTLPVGEAIARRRPSNSVIEGEH